MKGKLIAETTIKINAPTAKVWKAIIDPTMIKQYLFGTSVETDWREGSPITYKGEYEGKAYQDKGVIKKIVPEELFASTYWSSMGGKEDKPENYNLVTYALTPVGDDGTQVTLTQENVVTEDERKHATDNWNIVLGKLKEVVERNV